MADRSSDLSPGATPHEPSQEPDAVDLSLSAEARQLIERMLGEHPVHRELILRVLRTALLESAGTRLEEIEHAAGIRRERLLAPPDTAEPGWSPAEKDRLDAATISIAARRVDLQILRDSLQSAITAATSISLADYIADPPNVCGPKLLEILERFCAVADPESQLDPAALEGTRKRLAELVLSGDRKVVNLAKKFLTIPDYLEVVRDLITTNDGIGRIGGKAAGIVVAHKILTMPPEEAAKHGLLEPDPHPDFMPWVRPELANLTAQDCFGSFLRHNDLGYLRDYKYKPTEEMRELENDILMTFRGASFPPEIELKLVDFLNRIEGQGPFMVRSTSLLEDSTDAPFAGKYVSVMFSNSGTLAERLSELKNCIAEVYASTYSPPALEYRRVFNERFQLLDLEEEMGVSIQRMVGVQFGGIFAPAFAGVAHSYNDDLWDPAHVAESGAVSLVMGHGKAAVDLEANNPVLDVVLSHPMARPAGSSTEERIKCAQRFVFGVDLNTRSFVRHDFFDLQKAGALPPGFEAIVSTRRGDRLFPGMFDGIQYVTFDGLVDQTPFVEKMAWSLRRLRDAFGEEVDVEFASDLTNLTLLQCRHQIADVNNAPVEVPTEVPRDGTLVFRIGEERMLPTLAADDVRFLVQVVPERYALLKQEEISEVVRAIGKMNDQLPKRGTLMFGPGRWGTSWEDPWLGVPARFSDISNAMHLVEVIDPSKGRFEQPSFGTHWKNDLVVRGIKVIPLYTQRRGVEMGDVLQTETNQLAVRFPDLAKLGEIIRLIDIEEAFGEGKRLRLRSDRRSGSALAWID